MKYLKIFEEYNGYQEEEIPPGFHNINEYRRIINEIKNIIPMAGKPMNWEEIPSVDLEDLDDDILKMIYKLPVYSVTNLGEVFNRDFDSEDEDIKSMGDSDPWHELYGGNITNNNYIFFEKLKVPYQMFLIRFQMNDIDCGLLVDTQGFTYMRYVTIIKEFGEMYDYYKKDLELRNSTPNS
jgi:hypothetical protein